MSKRELTKFQEGQLLYIHFEGEFKYKTDNGNRAPRKAWSEMVYALVGGGYIEMLKNGIKITAKGREYLNAHRSNIAILN